MKFLMVSYESKEDFAARTDEARRETYWTAWRSYFAAMNEAGILAFPGNVLKPENETMTIHMENGTAQTAQGCYTKSAEPMSGYWLVDTADIEQAAEWAARAPVTLRGAVEIHPVW